ncbi:MAG: CRISPR-associated protein Csx3 [Candidatus Pacebacteria bacterium]|nr:CRISPR-associated protein Csx3 [Candidatus Paceibacterota bacterium]
MNTTTAPTVEITRNADVITFKHTAEGDASAKVRDTVARLAEMDTNGELAGGGLIKVTGPLLVPVAAAFGHVLAHRFSAVAFFVPPMATHVVAMVHGHETLKVGDTVA